MLNRLIAYLYGKHDQSAPRPGGHPEIKKKTLVKAVHEMLFGSRFLFEALFKVRILSHNRGKGKTLFDLATVLLQYELKKKMRGKNNLKLFEIGVGAWLPLSGYLSRFTDHPVVACDINPEAVRLAREVNMPANDLNIRIYVSDVFDNVPEQEFDLLWWNLPYYEDPEPYLSSLFIDAPRFMTFESLLIIGFNPKPLPVERVTGILSRYPSLEIKEQPEYWWNNHSIIVIQRSQQ